MHVCVRVGLLAPCVCVWVCSPPLLPPHGSAPACQWWVLYRAVCPQLLRMPKGLLLAQAHRWGLFS